MKRFIILILLFVCVFGSLFSQQSITRFAVVDMNRIVGAIADQSAEGKSFIDKRNRVQAEIEKQNKELQELTGKLQELNDKLAEVKEQGNNSQVKNLENQVKNLENQIRTKAQSLETYIRSTFADLERERERLLKNSGISSRIDNAVRLTAESEGYSLVLDRNNPMIQWFSPSIDITNKVIARLSGR